MATTLVYEPRREEGQLGGPQRLGLVGSPGGEQRPIEAGDAVSGAAVRAGPQRGQHSHTVGNPQGFFMPQGQTANDIVSLAEEVRASQEEEDRGDVKKIYVAFLVLSAFCRCFGMRVSHPWPLGRS